MHIVRAYTQRFVGSFNFFAYHLHGWESVSYNAAASTTTRRTLTIAARSATLLCRTRNVEYFRMQILFAHSFKWFSLPFSSSSPSSRFVLKLNTFPSPLIPSICECPECFPKTIPTEKAIIPHEFIRNCELEKPKSIRYASKMTFEKFSVPRLDYWRIDKTKEQKKVGEQRISMDFFLFFTNVSLNSFRFRWYTHTHTRARRQNTRKRVNGFQFNDHRRNVQFYFNILETWFNFLVRRISFSPTGKRWNESENPY